MDSKLKQIKIKLNVPEKTASYYKSQMNWEGEGGSTPESENIVEIDVPFKKGDLLEVINGVVDVRDNEVFYIVDVNKVTKS